MRATAAVGKTTLTHGLGSADPGAGAPADPASPQALVLEIMRAALGGHARRALDLLATAGKPEQSEIATAIGPEARHKLARHLPTDVGDTRPSRETAEILFQATPETELSTIELMFEARFQLQVGSHPRVGHGRKFDALGLRRMWTVLAALPAAHVAHDWAVANLDRYRDPKEPGRAHGAFGRRDNGAGEIDISYTDSIIRDGGDTDHDKEGDPLFGVNRFDEVARHEVGHAVDRELGYPSFNILCHTAEAGRWESYTDPAGYQKAADEMVRGSSGPIHRLPEAQRSEVVAAMVASMSTSTTAKFNHAIEGIHGHGNLKDDPVYRVMNRGLAVHNPWLSTYALGGRHYHQGYTGTGKNGSGAQWVSYNESAWANHRVSEYQFRAIQEWFAECYAAFYTPGAPGEPKGSRLQGKLPQTHAWFVDHVDNTHAVNKAAKKAKRRDHAPAKP